MRLIVGSLVAVVLDVMPVAAKPTWMRYFPGLITDASLIVFQSPKAKVEAVLGKKIAAQAAALNAESEKNERFDAPVGPVPTIELFERDVVMRLACDWSG
ncbi:hypothetical protein AB4072_09650 [Microvirga sp. 2MCAF38]|uniref:hypothetical protein n=1 Tax=Microvirga sp. 2MCAF38 TaxID=3232989 RepID=UPI003F9495DB